MPALKARDHIGALRQPIDNLSLALVAPLSADNDNIRHGVSYHLGETA
jgi:hypothetical protein